MKSLGNISRGAASIASSIGTAARNHGRVAVFIGETGNVAIISHYEPGYAAALETHSQRLVGVYQGAPDGGELGHPAMSAMASARDDLEHWMGFISLPRSSRRPAKQADAA